MDEVEEAHAERLAELLIEQVESLELGEHAEATILTAVARQLVRRTIDLGMAIESEAREIDDLGALQMATALQALGPAIELALEQVETHVRFGLMPARQPMRLPMPPPSRREQATGTNDPPPPPRPLYLQGPRSRRPHLP